MAQVLFRGQASAAVVTSHPEPARTISAIALRPTRRVTACAGPRFVQSCRRGLYCIAPPDDASGCPARLRGQRWCGHFGVAQQRRLALRPAHAPRKALPLQLARLLHTGADVGARLAQPLVAQLAVRVAPTRSYSTRGTSTWLSTSRSKGCALQASRGPEPVPSEAKECAVTGWESPKRSRVGR